MNNKQQFEYNSFSSCAKDADSMKKFFFFWHKTKSDCASEFVSYQNEL